MQTRLVLGGIALFLLGCALVVWIRFARPADERHAAPPWSIVAGFCVAGGAALFAAGMHQWRQRLPR